MNESAKLSPLPTELSRDRFVSTFGDIYEHSAWVAEAVWDNGVTDEHNTPAGLQAAMGAIVAQASKDQKLKLIRLHPDLAGKAARAGKLTDASTSEQASAGLHEMTDADFQRFQTLNGAYQTKFGFPFIIAVRNLTVADILAAFETRIDHDPDQEYQTALEQIDKIAKLRLDAMCQ